MPGDPRLQAGGGPLGMSNMYYQTGHGFWLPKFSDQEIANMPKPAPPPALTPAEHQQRQLDIQTDPKLYDLYMQTHPGGNMPFLGPEGRGTDYANQVYANKARQMWQQAVVQQQMQPGKGGSAPLPQGGLAVSTPGIRAADDPWWIQQAKNWFATQRGQYDQRMPGWSAPPPPETRPTTPAKSPISAAQQTSLQQTLAGKKQARAGDSFTQDGRTYRMNEQGAWVDVTDPNARVRVTNRAGGFLTDEQRAKNVAAGNAAAQQAANAKAFLQKKAAAAAKKKK